jgi:hypothetical protein
MHAKRITITAFIVLFGVDASKVGRAWSAVIAQLTLKRDVYSVDWNCRKRLAG